MIPDPVVVDYYKTMEFFGGAVDGLQIDISINEPYPEALFLSYRDEKISPHNPPKEITLHLYQLVCEREGRYEFLDSDVKPFECVILLSHVFPVISISEVKGG